MARAQSTVKKRRTDSSARSGRAGAHNRPTATGARKRSAGAKVGGKAKPGPRGGGRAKGDAQKAMQRRYGGGDVIESGREDLTVPTREPTRGPQAKAIESGPGPERRAISTRAALGFKDDD
jgi:hypothetical protein